MSNDEMQKLLDRVHKETTFFPYNKLQIPCIVFSERKFDEILSKVAGRPVSIDTNLNILQNKLGNATLFIGFNLFVKDGST